MGRILQFYWFWDVCWDDSRPWTLIFSLCIPIVPVLSLAEALSFYFDRSHKKFFIILGIFLSSSLNEFIFKPIIREPPLDNVCHPKFFGPSSFISISICVLIIRLFFYGRTQLFENVIWFFAFVLDFISRPILYYLSWTFAFLSLIPGIIVAILLIFCEKRKINFIQTLYEKVKDPPPSALPSVNPVEPESFDNSEADKGLSAV